MLRTLSRNPLPPTIAAPSTSGSLSTPYLYALGNDTVESRYPVLSFAGFICRSSKYLANQGRAITSQIGRGLEQWLISFKIDNEVAAINRFHAMCPKRLLDHIDTTTGHFRIGNAYLGVPTISQSIGQPRKSVWSRLRKQDFRHVTRPSAAEPTVGSRGNAQRSVMPIVKEEASYKAPSDDEALTMTNQFEFWAFVAMDFGRQEGIPSLRSGNTVIDERNFAMM